MPHAKLPRLDLWYDQAGKGPPVLGIMGLGAHADYWAPDFLAKVTERFSFVRFDNRAVGRSTGDLRQLTITTMADDAVGLLDHLGLAQVHVMGVSMGGMIAQDLALRHPGRLKTLTLCCTSPKPPRDIARLESAAALLESLVTGRASPLILSAAFAARYPEKAREFDQRVARINVPKRLVLRQLLASRRFDVVARLKEIAVPTLVMTGDHDLIMPHEQSDLLAQAIPGAVLRKFPGSGHGFVLENHDAVAALLTEFWTRHDSRAAGI